MFYGRITYASFTRLSHKRLLALCLSAGLIMGSLSGCGSQGSAATDTIAEPAVSATVGTTDNTAFPLPEGPEESTILSSRSTAFPMTFTVVWTLPPCWLWRTAA